MADPVASVELTDALIGAMGPAANTIAATASHIVVVGQETPVRSDDVGIMATGADKEVPFHATATLDCADTATHMDGEAHETDA